MNGASPYLTRPTGSEIFFPLETANKESHGVRSIGPRRRLTWRGTSFTFEDGWIIEETHPYSVSPDGEEFQITVVNTVTRWPGDIHVRT